MKVTIHQDKCVSAGQCVLLAPDVFDQREVDGVVALLDEDPSAELHEDVRQAARACPGRAIDVDEA